ncbi:unnamed protein product [Paramecium sonneborni]|uniref:Transmembrane protein n=1 Tax=Paramecium sonneborni TaxID=65129 RepID=A0A8S1MQ19_9CILI|nr:unnamed protein product [Paramecium sonneborni]
MMLFNDHYYLYYLSNIKLQQYFKVLIIHGTQLSIYTMFLFIIYQKCRQELNESSVISLALLTFSFMIMYCKIKIYHITNNNFVQIKRYQLTKLFFHYLQLHNMSVFACISTSFYKQSQPLLTLNQRSLIYFLQLLKQFKYNKHK